MTEGSRDSGGGATRGAVAFDNAGTLSDLLVDQAPVSGIASPEGPIPSIEDRRLALANVGTAGFEVFETDESLGGVIERAGIDLTPVLGSVGLEDPEPDAVRTAVINDRVTPANAVRERVRAIGRRAERDHPDAAPGIAVQLIVDLDEHRVCSVIGYAPIPRTEARSAVDRVRAGGYEPHIVSGDAGHVLAGVGAAVGIDRPCVHGDCSSKRKATLIESLRSTAGAVAMIGDYLNDHDAFLAADYAVLIDDESLEGPAAEALRAAADAVVGDLTAAVRSIEDEWGELG